MAVYLNYHKDKNGEIDCVGILTDYGLFHSYFNYNFDKVLEYLVGTEIIIVFGTTRKTLTDLMDPYNNYLSDQNLPKRWIDLGKLIYKETGERTTLRQVSKGTLNQNIPKLPKNSTEGGLTDVEYQLEQKLRTLMHIMEQYEATGTISFIKKDATTWVELNINENAE